MSFTTPLLVFAALAGVTPERAVWELRLYGHPVGFIEVELETGGAYRYASTHLYTRGAKQQARHRKFEAKLDAELETAEGRVPSALALMRLTAQTGCRPVVDELTGVTGELCVHRTGRVLEATLLGKRVAGDRDDRGALTKLRIGRSELRRVFAARPISPPDLVGGGIAVSGRGALAIEPPLKVTLPALSSWSSAEARALADEVHEASAEAGGRLCLDDARDFRARANRGGPARAAVVVGLRLEGERAHPHAWVAVRTEHGVVELDPTFGEPATRARYLPLHYAVDERAQHEAGAIWLSLLSGERRVLRR